MPTKTRSQHTVITYSGARSVDTLARSGLYAVNRVGEHVMAYTVTHTPTGFFAGEARTLKAARALAAHFHEVAGDAGAGWAFGAPLDMTSSEYARMLEAARTRPALS
jgi:hypothetical protein